MLVDSAVVDGEKPAMYYSRGEGGAFYSALAAEEELATTSGQQDGKLASTHRTRGAPEDASEDEGELFRDVDAREEERNGNINARAGSARFP